MSEEAQQIVRRLRENCDRLGEGYNERVEYKVKVAYHRNLCKYYGNQALKSEGCECPVVEESRSRLIKRPGLLKQLRDFQKNKDVDRNPKAARGAPRVKTPKMHPELAGFFTLDEITTDIYMTVDKALEEVGRDRTWASDGVRILITLLPSQVGYFADEYPDVAHRILTQSGKWINQAERTLKINVADAQFGDTVCGNCNGGLAIRWDNSGEVRCVGSPTTPPCGETYGPGDWLALFEKKAG